MNQSNCMVAQSGGYQPQQSTPVSPESSPNKKSGKYDTCYGAINGILGILNERYLNLFPDDPG